MRNHKKLLAAAVGASAVLGAGAAGAVDFVTDDWTFSATGNINAHYIYTFCDENAGNVAGSLLCATEPGENDNSSSIATGLLPTALVFTAATTQNDIDMGATIGFYPGIATNDFGQNGPNILTDLQQNGLDTTNLDLRQVFLTFGNADWGEIKMGRDFGLFGYDAIINDMTLLGVGPATNFTARSPANTTLGSIGFGYIYTDTPTQINYSTPNIGGLHGTIGVYQPYDAFNLSGFSSQTSGRTSEQPGFHAKLIYKLKHPIFPGFVSISGITQPVENLTLAGGAPVPGGGDTDAWAADVTGEFIIAGFTLLGHYYTTQGWGHTAYLFDGFDPTGQRRESDGYLGQITFPIGNTTLGAQYGRNNLDANPADAANPTLLDSNTKYTVGVYHSLTPNLTLLAEYTDAESENQVGGDISTQNVNVGAFLAF
jgi:predicted porin